MQKSTGRHVLLLLCCNFTATLLSLHIFSVCHSGGGDGLHNQAYLKRGT